MGEGPHVRKWVDVHSNKIGKSITSIEGSDVGKISLQCGYTLATLKKLGKFVIASFTSPAAKSSFFTAKKTTTRVYLKIHLGSGGSSNPFNPIMSLSFGRMRLNVHPCSGASVQNLNKTEYDRLIEQLSPCDVTGEHFNRQVVLEKLNHNDLRHLPLATVLLNQTVFAGNGNVIKIEVLAILGYHPLLPLSALSSEERLSLIDCIRDFALRWYAMKWFHGFLNSKQRQSARCRSNTNTNTSSSSSSSSTSTSSSTSFPMNYIVYDPSTVQEPFLTTKLFWLNDKGNGHRPSDDQTGLWSKYGRRKNCVVCNTKIKQVDVMGWMKERRSFYCPSCQALPSDTARKRKAKQLSLDGAFPLAASSPSSSSSPLKRMKKEDEVIDLTGL